MNITQKSAKADTEYRNAKAQRQGGFLFRPVLTLHFKPTSKHICLCFRKQRAHQLLTNVQPQ